MATKTPEEKELAKAEKDLAKAVDDVEEAEEDLKEIKKDLEKDTTKTKAATKKKTTTKKTTKKSSESKEEAPSKEDKLAALKAKAAALAGKVDDAEEIESKKLKESVKGEKIEEGDTLVPIEDYLKASIHLGTRVITPHMRQFVYRRRADGLAVFNTAMFDDKIKEGAKYLSQFAPEQIIVACKREAGWKAVKKFANTFGIKTYTKKYPAGAITNPNLDVFVEPDCIMITDPWIDKNILKDANRVKIKVASICDTNNYTFGIDQIIPGNNKSYKSIGMIYYLLTKLYAEYRNIEIEEPKIEDYVEGWATLQPPK